jgi:hypothetical protein
MVVMLSRMQGDAWQKCCRPLPEVGCGRPGQGVPPHGAEASSAFRVCQWPSVPHMHMSRVEFRMHRTPHKPDSVLLGLIDTPH